MKQAQVRIQATKKGLCILAKRYIPDMPGDKPSRKNMGFGKLTNKKCWFLSFNSAGINHHLYFTVYFEEPLLLDRCISDQGIEYKVFTPTFEELDELGFILPIQPPICGFVVETPGERS